MKISALIVLLGCCASSAAFADAQVMLDRYVNAAVVTEMCRGKALTMVEELGLGRLVRTESADALSSVSVLDSLAAARRRARPDCAAAAVQTDIRDFTDRVLPQLQWGSARPVAGLPQAAGQ